MLSSARQRALDLVLFGATGYIGGLVADELARDRTRGSLRWALAGRDRLRLALVRDRLAAIDPSCADLPLLTVDAGDRRAVAALAGSTRAVCTTVGPYAQHGGALVAACADQGTDYCDIAGERHWLRQVMAAHHQRARTSGARLVHACGFDSVPSDLGTSLLQTWALEHLGRPCDRVEAWFGPVKGPFGGGGAASALAALEAAALDRALRRSLDDPYALDPPPVRPGPHDPDWLPVSYNRAIGGWTGPFSMAAVNTRIVRRSHALLGRPWGEEFRYREGARWGGGIGGMLRALRSRCGLAVGDAMTRWRWVRALVRRLVPRPGTGPDAAARAAGHYRVELVGQINGVTRVQAELRDARDPACGATAFMLAQSALALARGETNASGGSLTPSTALGDALVARLRAGGMVLQARGCDHVRSP